MLKKISLLALLFSIINTSFAQKDSTAPKYSITTSGSVDAYFRNSFSAPSGITNNLTSFTNSNKKLALGMASLKVDQSIGKFAATVDLGVGKRAEEFSYNDNGFLAYLKQAYMSYTLTDKLKISAGKWATHVGYELLDAPLNRNYSMSYGFSYGPFFHTGFKADIVIGKKTALMVGIVDPTDHSSFNNKPKYIIAQISTSSKNDKVKGYLNFLNGDLTTQYNLVVIASITNKVSTAFDASINQQKFGTRGSSWSSKAFYINYDISEKLGLTLREDFFSDRTISPIGLGSINATTLSGKIKINKITMIPEVRIDRGITPLFSTKTGTATNASTFLVAAIYAF